MQPEPDKDLPLREDTRLLGRLLGDVLRAQTGDDGFARDRGDPADRDPLPPRRRREAAAAVQARARARCSTSCPSPPRSTSCARSATSRTSRTSPRTCTRTAAGARTRWRARRRSAAASPTRSTASPRTASTAARCADWFATALVSPVLTAHPTEVQRKSILDCEREIARLLQWRDRVALTPEEAARFETGLLPAGAGAVADGDAAPVASSRCATRSTTASPITATRSSPSCPRLYARAGGGLARRVRRGARCACRRSCGWARGSAATATAIRSSPPRRSSTRSRAQAARRVRALPRRNPPARAASCRCRRASCSRRRSCSRWPTLRTTPTRIAQDEPYRQALIGIYARARRDARRRSPGYVPRARAARRARRRTRRRPSFSPTSTIDRRVARARTARRRSRDGRLAPLHARRRGVRLPPRACSTCARTPTCTRRSSPSCSPRAGVAADYAALAEAERVALLARELAAPRLAAFAAPRLFGAHVASELAILAAAADIHRRFGAAALPNYVISKCAVGVRPARGRACC